MTQDGRLPVSWDIARHFIAKANPHYGLDIEKKKMLFWLLRKSAPGSMFVELGVCHGGTAALLALVASRTGGYYVGIDNWSLEGSYEEVAELLKDCDGVKLVQGSTHDVPLVPEIDFLLIDAGHDEANVSVDCRRWIPCVRRGGLVAFDDFPTGPGWKESAHWAVRHYADEATAEWELVAAWNGMVVRRRP